MQNRVLLSLLPPLIAAIRISVHCDISSLTQLAPGKGAPYEGPNLYVDRQGNRRCRECKRLSRPPAAQVGT